MNQEFLGTEFFSDEDRAYNGSRFSEVEQALFANPYQPVWGAHGELPLPIHKVTLSSVLRGLLPFGRPYVFRRVSEREVDSKADLRWGLDRKGYRRILHPNGICLTDPGRSRETRITPAISAKAAMPCWWDAIPPAVPKPGAATRARCLWSESSFPRPIRPMPSRCAPQASSPSRISAATTPTTSMMLSCAMLPTPHFRAATPGFRSWSSRVQSSTLSTRSQASGSCTRSPSSANHNPTPRTRRPSCV